MKTVFGNSEVAHVWANQLQETGRNSGSTFYFNGDSIYSYGSHFRIAKFHTNHNGVDVVLFTNRSYSNTTVKQVNITHAAARGNAFIYCNRPDGESHIFNFEQWEKSMLEQAAKLKSARKPELYLNAISTIFSECKKYADYFCIAIPEAIHVIARIQNKAEYNTLTEERASARLAADKKARAEREKALKKSIVLWRNFELHRLYISTGFDLLRYNKLSERVQTSQAVEIPKQIALDFYNQILSIVAKGGCHDCNIQFMNKYRVNYIEADHISVGCHRIKMSEIKNIVNQLTS